MAFYLITHLLLGLIAANGARVVARYRPVSSLPLWVLTSGWFPLGNSLSIFCAFAAIPTTFFKWGLLWSLVTLAQVFLGAFLAAFIPITTSNLLLLIGPVVSLILTGSLWGLWYIPLQIILIVSIGFFVLTLFLTTSSSSGFRMPKSKQYLSPVNVSKTPASKGNTANTPKETDPSAISKSQKSKISGQKETITLPRKLRSSDKLRVRAVLMKTFKYEVEKQALPFFESVVKEVQNAGGNKYDAAVEFMLVRLDKIKPSTQKQSMDFLEISSSQILAIQDKCLINRNDYKKRLSDIRRKHGLTSV